MSFNLNEWFKSNGKIDQCVRKAVVCKDGFRMSVQASEYHYCSPRISNATYYDEVEIGFPSGIEPSIMRYAEDFDNPTETVYGYVPVDIVEAIIVKHGGVKENEE